MGIKFNELKKHSVDYNRVKTLYKKAIPVYERAPFWFLLSRSKSKNIMFYSINDDDLWIGFVYFIFNNNLLIIQFFAIDDGIRSKGYGGQVLTKIKSMYPEYSIVLGIEKPEDEAENNEQRIKRKIFYNKNGFHESGYYGKQNKVTMELLLYGNEFNLEKLYGLLRIFFGKYFWRVISIFFKKRIKKV
jgi:GNAT superfamily N-acetyltransferase